MLRRKWMAGVVMAVAAVSLWAQDAPTTTLKVKTRIVILDVVVTDGKGRIFTDLKKDDFTIREDKVPQTIRYFEAPAEHAMPVSEKPIVQSSADLKKIGDAPVTILVLDELNTRWEDMGYAKGQMEKYLKAQPEVLKQATTVLAANNTKFVQVHDYTQNRAELLKAVHDHFPEYPWRLMKSGKSGPGAVERMAQSLSSLQQIAQAQTGTPGRKNVIWVGKGFPGADTAALDDKTEKTIEDVIHRTTNMLLAARITMYTIDPTANTTTTVDVQDPDDIAAESNENGGDPFAGTVQFSQFATETGGKIYASRNDIDKMISEGIEAGNNYYTLSYAPTDTSENSAKYRKIHVVMKNPNLRAVTRDGYFPEKSNEPNVVIAKSTPPKQAKALLQMDLSNAALSSMVYNGLGATAVRGAGNVWEVKVAPATLEWRDTPDGSHQGEVTVLVACFGKGDKLLGRTGRELTAMSKAENPQTSGVDAVFSIAVDVPAGTTRLRFVIRDAVSGRMGTVDIAKP